MAKGRLSRAPLLSGDGPLAKVTPLVAFVGVLAVFAVGVLVGGVVGALLLGLLAAGIVVMLAVTWQLLTVQERFVRIVALALLIGIAASLVW
jgi:hypothetical protein